MSPDDIRKLYDRETPATPDEFAATTAEILRDPNMARDFWDVLYALQRDDDDIQHVIASLVVTVMAGWVRDQMDKDDAYALQVAKMLLGIMQEIKPPPVYRAGRYRKGRTA